MSRRNSAVTEERLNLGALLVLLVLAGILAYTTFEWGGVVRNGRYEYLLILGLLAIVWSLGRTDDKWAPPPGNMLKWSAALLPTYVFLQVIPLPVTLLRVVSPVRAEGVNALTPVGAKINFASVSVFPAGTFEYLLLICGYLVIFVLARELTGSFGERPWRASWPILGVAILLASLGLWQYLAGNGQQDRWGTFANHNHFAGFLEMSLPFAVMYPVALLARSRSRSQSSIKLVVTACGVWALAGMIFASIIYSFSRMGFIAALFSIFVMGTFALGSRHLGSIGFSRKRQWGAIGLVATLVLASFAFLPPDRLIQRFAGLVSASGVNEEGRSGLWIETIPLIKAYPVFGCGLDSYETAFSKFKKSGLLVTDDFAHNDYLQLLAELGLVGFVIWAALALSVVKTTLQGAVKSPDSDARYFAVACAGALGAIALHSLVDFNLYIPANAMLLAWIAGMGVATGSRKTTISDWGRLEHLDEISEETPEPALHHY